MAIMSPSRTSCRVRFAAEGIGFANVAHYVISALRPFLVRNIFHVMVSIVHHWADQVVHARIYAHKNGGRRGFYHIGFLPKADRLRSPETCPAQTKVQDRAHNVHKRF